MIVDGQQSKGFILHSRRFRENSRIVEAFTEVHGRISLIVRISRKKNASNTSKYQPFRELALQWRGRSELQNLQQADELQHYSLNSPASICALYCNELLLYLTSKFIPMPVLYDVYQQTLLQLAQTDHFEPVLRRFELNLLQELGYGIDLYSDHLTGDVLAESPDYYFHPGLGLSVANPGQGSLRVSITDVYAMRVEDFSQQTSAKTVKIMLGSAIDYLLEGRTLKSRQLFRDMVRLNS